MALPKFIRALRNDDGNEWWRFYHNAKDGEGAVVTYNFMTTPRGVPLSGSGFPGFETYSAPEVAAIQRALNEFSSVANVRFVRGGSQDEEVMFGKYDISGAGGYAFYPMTDVGNGQTLGTQEVYIHADYSLDRNKYGYLVALHEIGHALGLKHPHEGKDRLSAKEDTWQNTVMTYNNASTGDFKLAALDIIALQSIYGPAQKRLGANSYKFGSDKVIWDGGGMDTLSASHLKAKVHVDLNGGTWNWIGSKSGSIVDRDQFWIGHFTKIENASGGQGDDTLYGNELANVLKGNAGHDKLHGRAGNDRIFGGDGNDILRGGLGGDVLTGGRGKDKFVYASLYEMGKPGARERITDFTSGDRLDFRGMDANFAVAGRQKAKFLGNFAGEREFGTDEAGSFYFNRKTDTLVFEANGDGMADYAIALSNVSSVKSSYFIL